MFFDERCVRRRYVLDPDTGFPVVAVSAEVFDAEDFVLHVPEDEDDALQLMVEPQEVDSRNSPAADRYAIYHGKPGEVHLLRLEILSAKFRGHVFEGSELACVNPFGSGEAGLCKVANQRASDLTHLCARSCGTSPAAPVLVGVDPHGLDVRARFGVIRVDFPRKVASIDEARSAIEDLLRFDAST